MTKQEQRKTVRDARKALDPFEKKKKSRRICETLLTLPEVAGAKHVFSYIATKDEVDLSFLHSVLSAKGTDIAFPLSHTDGTMKAYIPKEDNAFLVESGSLGLTEPIPEKCREAEPGSFDLVLVPCVGFDRRCSRLGHGKGYYDRYLPACKSAKFIAVAFECQKLDKVVTEKTDIRMNAVITEDAVYK